MNDLRSESQLVFHVLAQLEHRLENYEQLALNQRLVRLNILVSLMAPLLFAFFGTAMLSLGVIPQPVLPLSDALPWFQLASGIGLLLLFGTFIVGERRALRGEQDRLKLQNEWADSRLHQAGNVRYPNLIEVVGEVDAATANN